MYTHFLKQYNFLNNKTHWGEDVTEYKLTFQAEHQVFNGMISLSGDPTVTS